MEILKEQFKKIDLNKNKIKDFMTKNPVNIEKNTLAAKALNIMNEKNNMFMRFQKEM